MSLGRYLYIFSRVKTFFPKNSHGRSAGVFTSRGFFLKASATTWNLKFVIVILYLGYFLFVGLHLSGSCYEGCPPAQPVLRGFVPFLLRRLLLTTVLYFVFVCMVSQSHFLSRSMACSQSSRMPKAVSLTYPSPLGPNPTPGVHTTRASYSICSKKRQLLSPFGVFTHR